ncbi:hypothetical protein CE91St46_36760 [Eubacteriales bacterium]|nr:hypothetical protein CE91St46_36760 [Eubacteriales bacterium]GKH65285.1 hypothetical protein CE91St47_37540 [Eubacteriales bacterium]
MCRRKRKPAESAVPDAVRAPRCGEHMASPGMGNWKAADRKSMDHLMVSNTLLYFRSGIDPTSMD